MAKTAAAEPGREQAKVFCICGGEMKSATVFRNGKLKNIWRCLVCGNEERLSPPFRTKAVLK